MIDHKTRKEEVPEFLPCGHNAHWEIWHSIAKGEQCILCRAEKAELDMQLFGRWQTRAMSIIAPLSEGLCNGNAELETPKDCIDVGITGSSACLRCRAKHFRENSVVESYKCVPADDILPKLKRLVALLEDPHPGLFTWNEACQKAWANLHE